MRKILIIFILLLLVFSPQVVQANDSWIDNFGDNLQSLVNDISSLFTITDDHEERIEILEASGNFSSGNYTITYPIIVASYDANSLLKAQASFVCDGVDDDVEIHAALDLIPDAVEGTNVGGGEVVCVGNRFNLSGPILLDEQTQSLVFTKGSLVISTSDSDIFEICARWVHLGFDTVRGTENVTLNGIRIHASTENNSIANVSVKGMELGRSSHLPKAVFFDAEAGGSYICTCDVDILQVMDSKVGLKMTSLSENLTGARIEGNTVNLGVILNPSEMGMIIGTPGTGGTDRDSVLSNRIICNLDGSGVHPASAQINNSANSFLFNSISGSTSEYPVSFESGTISNQVEICNKWDVPYQDNGDNTVIQSGGEWHTVYTESASVYHNTAQSINNSTWTILSFNSERWDNGDFHSTSTNPSRLTCNRDGKYELWAKVEFTSNSTGYRAAMFYKNGSSFTVYVTQPAINGTSTIVNVSFPFDCVEGDYWELRVFQNSGGSLNVAGDVYFAIHRIG